MAAPIKKRAVPQNMVDLENNENGEDEIDEIQRDNDSGQEEQDMEGDEFINQNVTVDFEARNLEDCDFHGVRKLLSQLFLKANIDLSEMTDTLISQNYIGSAIKQVEPDEEDEMETEAEDENSVFGVISVLNITERKSLACVQQLKSVLLERCAQCADRDKLAAVLADTDKHVGLVLSERFINIPPQIAVPSYDSLWKEVERAKKKRMPYTLSSYLLVCKVGKLAVPTSGGGQSHYYSYTNPEEELFREAASVVCEYSVAKEHDSLVSGAWDGDAEEMEPCRVVLVVPGNRIDDVMAKMKQAYG